jgi:Zn-dependent M28 family amino/carboxypeptidase
VWTGEEQGLLGSRVYARRAHTNGESIEGYLNLDMIAWNTVGSSPVINLYYSTSVPGTQAMAQQFADVVDTYDLNLIPILGTGLNGSDHSSFWQYGYKSILGIEDNDGDWNPYYHSSQDTPANTDLAYFTEFVKASVADYAHLADCLIPPAVDQFTFLPLLAGGPGHPLAYDYARTTVR